MTKILSKASGFLALLGAVLTLAFLFAALRSAEGARVSKLSDAGTVLVDFDALEECRGIADGTAVTQWDDQSGNARHATQATGSAQPTCQTAAGDLVNGRPVIRFDGSNDVMSTGAVASPNFRAPLTVFVVSKVSAVSGGRYVLSKRTSTTTGFGVGLNGSVNGRATSWGVKDYDSTAAIWNTNNFVVATFVYDDTTQDVSFYTDSAFDSTAAGALNATADEGAIHVGAGDGSSFFWNGDVAQIVAYDSVLSDVNRRAVEKLLRMKWTGARQPAPAFFVGGKLPAKQKPGNCTDSNVAAWLSMDEASGNLTVPAGCAAAATVMTATGSPTYGIDTTNGPFGGLGGAIDFNGTNAYFTSTTDVDALDLGASDSFSFETWFRTDDTSGTHGCVAGKMTAAGSTSVGWCLYHSGANVQFFLRDADGDQTSCVASSVLTAGRWHYVRAYGTPQSASCTVDGTAGAETPNAAVGSVSNTAPFEVGHTQWTQVTQFLDGAVAGLRVTIGNTTNSLFNGYAYSGFGGSTLAAPTFTRANASTRYNPVNGFVESVRPGVPVVGSPLSGGDDGSIDPTEPTGVYVGSATTFLALNNEDFTNASWTEGSITETANQDTAPDGSLTADLLAPTDTNGWKQTDPAGATECVDTDTCTFTIWLRSATGSDVNLSIHVYNGTATARGTQAITVTTTWQRFVVTGTGLSGDNLRGTLGGGSTWSTGENIYAWRGQFYEKAFAVPLDPSVTSASVAVNADVMTYTRQLSTAAGSIVFWQHISGVVAGSEPLILTSASSGRSFNYFTRQSGGAGGPRVRFNGGTDSLDVSIAGAPTPGSWFHHAATWDRTNSHVSIYQTGVRTLSSTADSWSSEAVGASLNIEAGSGGSFWSDLRLFDEVLTPQQIRALYLSKSSLYAARDLSPREQLRRKVMLASAAPLDMLWGIFSERRMEQERIDSAKRYVRSPDFPQPTWVMPQEASAP